MSSHSGGREHRGRRPRADDAEAMENLRRIFLAPDRDRLTRLERRPPVNADSVAEVLPEGLVRATESRAEALSIALEPVMATAVETIVRKNPEVFGEVLAPTIGVAVRKSVSDAIKAMLQRLDEVLQRSLSIESVQWRIEAKRTGRPLAEIVMLRTLVFRVEQVFLIHPHTGVVLQHVSAADVGAQDPDQVASMLEAIDAFVREAFQPQVPEVHLSQVEVGDLTVWIDRSTSLAVAAVVRGTAPRELSEVLRDVRERIHLAFEDELTHFRSDVTPFAPAQPILESCLVTRLRAPTRKARILVGATLALLLAAFGALTVRSVQHQRLLRSYVEALEDEPGIVLTSALRSDGRIRIRGLRDPVATAPDDVLALEGLPPADLAFAPFVSLEPLMVERRAQQTLRPPSSVTLEVDDGTLTATGTASRRWIMNARLIAPRLPGVARYEDRHLVDERRLRAMREQAELLEGLAITFRPGSSLPVAPSEISRAHGLAGEVVAFFRASDLPGCIQVIGRAGPTGFADEDERLSRARAAHVAQILGIGEAAPYVQAVGAGPWRGVGPADWQRSVTFEVEMGTSCTEAK